MPRGAQMDSAPFLMGATPFLSLEPRLFMGVGRADRVIGRASQSFATRHRIRETVALTTPVMNLSRVYLRGISTPDV